MNQVRRELTRERLGLRRRSLRSRRFGWVQPCRRRASGSYKAPNPKEAPSTKLQNDRPLRLDKGSAVAGRSSWPGRLWDLKLGASLELGVWSLELQHPTHSKSVARAKAVTSRTPSPQSKTWRQIRRFTESLNLQGRARIGAMNGRGRARHSVRAVVSAGGNRGCRRRRAEDCSRYLSVHG